MVFYRKYRPQTLEELDLTSVREKLRKVLSSQEVPHALLFTGPKGLGKTSSARIVAAVVNTPKDSKKAKDFEKVKKQILEGSHVDVMEIDAASNRGIDEIRALRDRIKYAPTELAKKVYIIDEVHMLTTEAFNALLKTLEEPPSHVMFILATTELHKVPQTIISRAFHTQFTHPSKEEAMRSLKRIVEGEKIQIDEEALEMVHKLSEGSFRDAAKILEELSISEKGTITLETINAAYQSSSFTKLAQELLNALSESDAQRGLNVLNISQLSGNRDYALLIEAVISELRTELFSMSGIGAEKRTYSFEKEQVYQLLEILTESYRQTKYSPAPSLPLELAILRFCANEKKPEITKPDLKKAEVKIKAEEKKEVTSEVQAVPEPKTDKVEVKTAAKEPEEKHGELFDKSLAENFFDALLSAVKQDNHSVAGVLRSCKLVEISEDGKVIFTAPYEFHRERLSSPKTRDIIENRASKILNKKITLVVEKG